MRSKIAILYLVLLALGGSSLYAQGLKSHIRRANKLYQAKDYAGATQEYRRALLRDSLSGKANFGISAAAYGQGRYDEAKDYLERAAQDPRLTPRQQAGVLHNLGNVAMQKKDYQSAVQSYEEALIRNPEDDNTRYNLALAQKLLQQQNKNNKSQSQQGQDQNKPDQKPQQGKDKQGQPNEQRSGELSKEQAEQILRSFRTDDDKTRRRVEQEQRQQQNSSNKNKKRW